MKSAAERRSGTGLLGGRRKTVLIALAGMSPGVITETVWALAREEPPVVPDEVIVVTTVTGRRMVAEELLESGVWERLRRQLGCGRDTLKLANIGHYVRTIPNRRGDGELGDIVTAADNEAVGDFLVETLRGFVENGDTRVVFSIAGGRKTMGLLAGTAMSLLGRAEDRLCHVLVNAPFDSGALTPRFFFPDATVASYRLPGDEREYVNEDAEVTLADIPFVPLRYLFTQRFRQLPGGFMGLVRAVSREILDEALPPPQLEVDCERRRLLIDDTEVKLSPFELALVRFLAEQRVAGEGPIMMHETLHDEFTSYLGKVDLEEPWASAAVEAMDQREKKWKAGHDGESRPRELIRQDVSRIQKKIEKAAGQHAGEHCTLSRGGALAEIELRLPAENIAIIEAGTGELDVRERPRALEREN